MSANPPECYTIDSQARCLRVEITATRSLVLPLDQFVFAELLSEDREQRLRLTFATHEVLIYGHVLRRIETAIQRMELTGLMKVPGKYHGLIAENQPKIRDIIVSEIKPTGQLPEALN
jgi:hypothetical protein